MASHDQTKTAATTTAIASPRGRYKGATTADQTEISGVDLLRFEAIRNGRYHLARQGWYERWHRICMFVVVIGGTAAVAQAMGHEKESLAVALIPTIAGTIDLLFDF